MIDHTPIGNPCETCGKPARSHRIDHIFKEDPLKLGNCLTCNQHRDLHRTARKRPHHIPAGNPCEKCGIIAVRHRVGHKMVGGDPCAKCGLFAHSHKKRSLRKTRNSPERRTYIGIDGEGQDDGGVNGIHRYTLLAAKREVSYPGIQSEWIVEAKPGESLTTVQCLDLILELPTKYAKIFSYSFNYDLTKILTDLDNESLYLLFRPELRQRTGPDAFKGPYYVKWGEYRLNLQGTKFTVCKGTKRVVVWDLFKFFQAKFVSALKDWKVGSEELLARMSGMKDKRGGKEWHDLIAIKAYCLEECQCIAELGHKLIAAHEEAGLKLKTYYGAGSSGAAMLNVMGIREVNETVPPEMKHAVACGFFGGRFENSVIGSVHEHLYNYDISSAYPYHTTFLPCLLHGRWVQSENRDDLETARAALVRYTLDKNPGITTWGPFPFRAEDGSISFPIESGGGWVWKEEYLAGERLFPHIHFKSAWIYRSDCDCQPFAKIPEYYLVRLRIGKEGAGIVIKLAVNSCYGKLAQSVGNALYNNWIWAGMITSGCRAQILDMLGLHKDWANLLTIATDGIYTRERLITPEPRNTNTSEIIHGKSKPLGAWEEKECPKGVFFARPGIYFPINPTEAEIKEVRARGVGRGVVLTHWKHIVETWEKEGVGGIARVPDVVRFCGAKTSIAKSSKGYTRAARGRTKKDGGYLPAYGQWVKRRVEMSFDPLPKRAGVNPDGLTLALRKFPLDLVSLPYDRALISKEGAEMKAAVQEGMEQPDAGDFLEGFDL